MTSSLQFSMPHETRSLRVFDPTDEDAWDTLTASHPQGSFFHTTKWARVLCATYGHIPHYLGVMEGNQPRALLPILEVNSPLTGRRGVSLPFSDECGLLCFEESDGEEIIRSALELARERRWKYLELRGNIPGDRRPSPWVSYVGHEMDLAGGAEALFTRLDGSVRRAIRKAEKVRVETRVLDTLEATQTFYALHCLTRRKHGVPPQPFSFFQNIFEQVLKPGSGFIVVAIHEGTPIAGGLFVHDATAGIYKFGASSPAHLPLRGNDLVMWAAIKWYASRGFSRFSMGRTAIDNEGLRRFKSGFGAREYPINYFRYDLRREAFVTGHAENTGWINRLFRLTPAAIVQIIGRLLYRHMD
jgi:hypothetical protein